MGIRSVPNNLKYKNCEDIKMSNAQQGYAKTNLLFKEENT
jgi:hypothetical protein